MPQLDNLQSLMLDYLSGKNQSISGLVADQGNVSVQTRLDIYKNAYQIRLKQALETDHELLGIYLGDALFDELAEGYVHKHPSHYTSLRHFGESLPEYLHSTKPFSQHPILSEISLFERRLMDVFDAADANRLGFAALEIVPIENWPILQLRFHPSLQLLNTEWNSIESWKALKDKRDPPPAHNTHSQHWMLWRSREHLSEFRPLQNDEYRFIYGAVKGEAFSELCEALLKWHSEEDIGEVSIDYLRRWFEQGIITGLENDY